ncbi:MAG: PepSY-like domain-containing protein [Bacteroidales bacterium]|jgi:hypothetical protein|nr:PepSY-like domain-containing protein [Bacteroidales bacterium]
MRKIAIITLATAFFMMSSCEKSNGVNTACKKSLEALYPNAKFVEWEYDDGFLTAEFRNDGMDVKVWFDENGNWLKIETDMPFRKLPKTVQDAFNNSDYADWRIDDVDHIQIQQTAPQGVLSFYEFDVEKREMEKEFVIYPDGTIADKPHWKR